MRHTTVPECPACLEHERAVADPDTAHWHCFYCGSSGTYVVSYTIERRGTRAPDPMIPDLPSPRSVKPDA